MTIFDLFDWCGRSIYGDLTKNATTNVRRNLQIAYEAKLIELATKPAAGTAERRDGAPQDTHSAISGEKRDAR